MKDIFVFLFICAFGVLVYLSIIMPIRKKLCATHNMTAVWYIQGCVNKEVK